MTALTTLAAAASAQPQPQPQPAPEPPPIAPPRDVAYPGQIALQVDARDTTRRILQVHETIPVAGAGPMTLLYPRWLPGNHSPSGPLSQLAGLIITANGSRV